MRVGILGSGLMSGKLGTIFARAGHDVVFSCARRHEKLKELARDTRGTHERAHFVRLRRRRALSCWPGISFAKYGIVTRYRLSGHQTY